MTQTFTSTNDNEVIARGRSILTNQINTMVIPLSKEEYQKAYKLWEDGMLIQKAFPTLNAHQREFILNGTTPEEWAKYLPEDEEIL